MTIDLWLLLALASMTYLSRYIMLVALQGRQLPSLVVRYLRFAPIAILAALATSATLPGPGLSAAPGNLIAAGVASAVAWRTGNLFATIVAGVLAAAVLRAIS